MRLQAASIPLLALVSCVLAYARVGLSPSEDITLDDLSNLSTANLTKAALNSINSRSSSFLCLEGVFDVPRKMYNRISIDAHYDNFVEELVTFPERRPRTFNVLLATAKTWLADAVVQFTAGSRTNSGEWKFDGQRSAAFALFGLIYIGLGEWLIFVSIFTSICPHAMQFANEPLYYKWHDVPGQLDLLKQICFDNFIVNVFIYFPLFYIIKETVRVGFMNFGFQAILSALGKYRTNFKTDNIACWSVGIPSDFIIFGAPMFLRLPLDHVLSFAWTMILSHMRGSEDTPLK